MVILIKPNALDWVTSGMDTPQSIQLPLTVIANLEVLNRDSLYTVISDWAKARTYTTTEVVWLLSQNTYFEQIFPDSEKEKWDSSTVQFLDTVPFEEVISKVYTPVEGRQVVATNKDFVMALIQGFAMHGYNTRAVVPAKFATSETELSGSVFRSVTNHVADLARDSLVTVERSSAPVSNVATKTEKKKSSLPLLLAIFGALLIVLVAVLFLRK